MTIAPWLRILPRLAPAVLIAAALGGCISLFPKVKPAQLYRFGAAEATAPAAAPRAGTFAVRLAPLGFQVSTAGDRILTIDGDRVAYIAGGRWVSAASNLFEAAVIQTFETRGGAGRLAARGEITPTAYVLKLDVRRFEARYEGGAPTATVEVYAALDSPNDPALDRQRIFTAKAAASDNRIGPIAAAFDQAVTKVCAEIADWVSAKGA